MEDTIKEELPVITKISLMKSPEDFKRNDSDSSTPQAIIEPTKEKSE